MGISSCNILSWTAKNIKLRDLNKYHNERSNNILKLDIDVNNIACTVFSGMTEKEVVNGMAFLCKMFAHECGFIVTLIFDGDVLHDSKRDSLRRKAREYAKINTFIFRQKAMEIGATIDECSSSTNDERSRIFRYNDACRKLEKLSTILFSMSLIDILREKLIEIGAFDSNESNHGYISSNMMKSKFQADSILAKRRIDGLSDFIYSNDSDFLTYLGPLAVIIKSIKFSKDKGKK